MMKPLPKLITLLFLLTTMQLSAQVVLDSKKFDAEGIRKVELKGSFVDISVEGVDGDLVTFDGLIEGNSRYKGDISIESKLDGDVLEIWIERAKRSYSNIKGRLTVGVPINVEVDISASSGNLSARNLESKKISLTCSSGNIQTNRLTGDIYLKTSSGNISGFMLSGVITARASSGNLDLVNINGDIESRASSGNIKIKNAEEGTIRAEASSGNIYLEDLTGNFDIHCSSGNIKGSGITLTADSDFDTTSGTISIDVTNDIDDLSVDLRASSGRVSAGSRRGREGRLETDTGKYKLSARSNSGNINID